MYINVIDQINNRNKNKCKHLNVFDRFNQHTRNILIDFISTFDDTNVKMKNSEVLCLCWGMSVSK